MGKKFQNLGITTWLVKVYQEFEYKDSVGKEIPRYWVQSHGLESFTKKLGIWSRLPKLYSRLFKVYLEFGYKVTLCRGIPRILYKVDHGW